MHRFRFFISPLFVFLASFAAANAAAGSHAPKCRQEYVVPYSEQCDFAHTGIKKDGSPANVGRAFQTCDRAQDEAGACLSSPVKQVHIVALSALYRAISQQADIAMFAGQYRTAESLLREEMNVLKIADKEGKPGDPALAAEHARVKADLASTASGECTERAYLNSAVARTYAKAKRYKDLEKTLISESSQYQGCAKIATTRPKKAYIEYIGLVAIEEAGRAAQASGDDGDANKLYNLCMDGTSTSKPYAAPDTKKYLGTLLTLCKGRREGTYKVDQPRPLDQPGGAFQPLALPKKT